MKVVLKWFMCLVFVVCVSGGVAVIASAEMAKWIVDKDHTTLGFEVVHMNLRSLKL